MVDRSRCAPAQKKRFVMENNALKNKTTALSLSVIRLYRTLNRDRGNEVLARQLLRSATSIGANVREAVYGLSRADFIAKMQIALKETAETEYWIELLRDSDTLPPESCAELLQDCVEIKRILIATLKSCKSTP